ncbi:DUF4139 domain-containing protein [Insolitispirillum peregrinum]|uniref:DUF4139 domain-containing protein n=1 Tax=Insolitispirillum peregrinum TaxID=80876 RepID=UPI00361D6893
MKARPSLAVTLLASAASILPVLAHAETASSPDVALTVYQNGLTLVEDHRRMSLAGGSGTLAFDGVAQDLLPTSVQVSVPKGAVVREQSYQPPLDLQQLLRANVGQTITVVQTSPTGAPQRQTMRLLRAQPDVLLDNNGTVISGLPGQPEFPGIPAGLAVTPRLSAVVQGMPDGEQDVVLRYLSGGLSWHADHVLTLATGGKSVALTTWATLTNSSGAAWSQAKVALIAGQVNRAEPVPMPAPMMMKAERVGAAAPAPQDSAPQRESLGGYHLYTLPGKVTLADGETRQFALLQAASLPAEVLYEVRGSSYGSRSEEESHPAQILSFRNEGLSAPLPAGTARVYGADSSGAARFLGEDGIASTSDKGAVRLALGEAFDIGVTRSQTSFRKVSDNTYEAAYKIVLRNAQNTPVTVKVIDSLPGDWSITAESAAHQSPDASRAEWSIALPAAGSTTLTYSVRVTS